MRPRVAHPRDAFADRDGRTLEKSDPPVPYGHSSATTADQTVRQCIRAKGGLRATQRPVVHRPLGGDVLRLYLDDAERTGEIETLGFPAEMRLRGRGALKTQLTLCCAMGTVGNPMGSDRGVRPKRPWNNGRHVTVQSD